MLAIASAITLFVLIGDIAIVGTSRILGTATHDLLSLVKGCSHKCAGSITRDLPTPAFASRGASLQLTSNWSAPSEQTSRHLGERESATAKLYDVTL
jgi:hypothetical protein